VIEGRKLYLPAIQQMVSDQEGRELQAPAIQQMVSDHGSGDVYC
jgi:hypothetical protein